MKLKTYLAFLLAFSLEVQVHALDYLNLQENPPSAVIPEGCLLNNEYPCAVLGHEATKLTLNPSDRLRVVLIKSASVVLLAPNRVRVLDGNVFVDTYRPTTVSTEFGDLKLTKGEAWVYNQDDRFYFESVDGFMSVRGRGFNRDLNLRPGLRAWLGPVNSKGVSDAGLPDPILLKEFLTRMAQITELPRLEFKEKIEKFVDRWKISAHYSSEISQALIDRQVASDDEARKRRLQSEKQNRLDERRAQKLFYERNYLDK